jgi:mono/diheme cytochrome c family protein
MRDGKNQSRDRKGAVTRVRSLTVAVLSFCALLTMGCQQEMAKQPSYRPQQPSAFFRDGRADRPRVPGTVAQGELHDDPLLYEGRDERRGHAARAAALLGLGAGGRPPLAALAPEGLGPLDYADVFPFPITMKELERGRQRFNIFCAVCHDPSGNGNGKIPERGYTKPPSYITDYSRGFQLRGYKVLLRDAPVGYLFEVVTKGMGAMPDYSAQVPVEDRWKIVAYIRALQFSQHAPLDRLPPKVKEEALKELEGTR